MSHFLSQALSTGVAIPDIPSNLLQGMQCYVGIGNPGNPCTSSAAFLNAYMAFNIAYNILIIAVLKYGSSNVLWLCLTILVPVQNLFFAIPGSEFRT